MIRALKIITLVVGVIVCWFLATEWHPHQIEEATIVDASQSSLLGDEFEVVSWNIGYAGLGEEMDFFYDGGVQTRCSEAKTRENLGDIISQLKKFAKSADFILLQEVDEDSHRTYGINIRQAIAEALPEFHYTWAYNYRSKFVPLPLGDPMGRVNSGIMTLSRHKILRSVRYQYPSIPSLPERLFLLKRAMLSAAILTNKGDTLWVNNTHNSAFNNRENRERELVCISSIIENQSLSITAGDWNSTPPDYQASEAALGNEFFQPLSLSRCDLPQTVEFAVDTTTPTMRYLNRPYNSSISTVCNIDFGVVSQDLHVKNCTVIDLGFKNSDHNPIVFLVNSACK